MKTNGKWMSCFRSTCWFVSHEQGLGPEGTMRHLNFQKRSTWITKAGQEKKLLWNTKAGPTVNQQLYKRLEAKGRAKQAVLRRRTDSQGVWAVLLTH